MRPPDTRPASEVAQEVREAIDDLVQFSPERYPGSGGYDTDSALDALAELERRAQRAEEPLANGGTQ